MDEEIGGLEQGAPAGEDELTLVREVVLQANPDVVPELIAGSTIAELLASVEPAKAAFGRISERVKPAATPPPAVPAGAATVVVDPGSLPPSELIRRGIEGARRKGARG